VLKLVDSQIAQKFVNRITKQLGYNVNVMDERGIIIASSDCSRIGSFHQGAYNMINEKKSMDYVKDNYEKMIGVQPGINLPVHYKNSIIGAVGISGDPDVVMPFVKLVKLTFETMLEYELYTDSLNKTRMNGDKFIDALLFEKPKNFTKIKRYSKEAGYYEKYPRLPIIVNYDIPIASERILNDLKAITSHSCQDIIYLPNKGRLVILKIIPQANISNYKNLITLYINEIGSIFPKLVNPNEVDCFHSSFYVGTVQTNYGFYSEALNHSQLIKRGQPLMVGTSGFFLKHEIIVM
jgi:carbohydrate diacid regulator